MTLKFYIGTADEVTARLAGAPNSTTTTISTTSTESSLYFADLTTFTEGNSIVVGKYKTTIQEITSFDEVIVSPELPEAPDVGTMVRHYNADYTKYRDQSQPFSLVDDRKTGGNTGNAYGQDLTFFDSDGLMPNIIEQNLLTIFDSTDDETPLFAGPIVSSDRIMRTKDGSATPIYQWQIEAWGYQWEADSVGVDEQPFTNINAGEFLQYLAGKWTNLTIGEVDTENSPNLDFVRLSPFRRFSDAGQDVANLWPGSEFYIQNNHTTGALYFRQEVQQAAPIILNQDYLDKIGNRRDQFVRIRKDYEKVFNIVLLPYYKEQIREPDFHVQSTVVDNAFLKTSVTLAGQPSLIEESQLLFDDFSDGTLSTDFTEDDIDNPDPPLGFNNADGFLVEGEVNDVAGLHLLDTTDVSATIQLGDVGRVTDPAEVEPFTGTERQMLFAQELVVNTLGDAVVMGIVDQTTVQTTALSGSTTSRVYVTSTTGFVVGDRIAIDAGVDEQKGYISAIGAGYFDLLFTLDNTPDTGATVSLHRLAKSRIKFGVYFKANGDLKYILNGVETAFDTPRTYSAVNTYSLRLFMQCFETTVAGGVSSTGCTLNSATGFSDGDVVEIFTTGSRLAPERKIIQVGTGNEITYSATSQNPEVGYRVRTLPKMVLQIKGGSEFGDITGREWTTIYTAVNTWQDDEVTDKDDHGVLLCLHKSLVATFTLFQMKDPIPVTAQVGDRYLHVGTQEIDSTEPDVDCIVRKVGSHFQLDFFPDTKALWPSGEALELRYKERWRVHLQTSDIESIKELAEIRGHAIPENATEQMMVKLGGRALDTLELLPFPLTDAEALLQSRAILDAVSTPAFSMEIMTNTVIDQLCRAGQIIRSELPGVPDMQIQKVEIKEFPGAQGDDGQSLYRQRIIAGTVDRLSEVLRKRTISKATRLVIDDGRDDDTFSKLLNAAFKEIATVTDRFIVTSETFEDANNNGIPDDEENDVPGTAPADMNFTVWLAEPQSGINIDLVGANSQVQYWRDSSGNGNDFGWTLSGSGSTAANGFFDSGTGIYKALPWYGPIGAIDPDFNTVEVAGTAHKTNPLAEWLNATTDFLAATSSFTMFFVLEFSKDLAVTGGNPEGCPDSDLFALLGDDGKVFSITFWNKYRTSNSPAAYYEIYASDGTDELDLNIDFPPNGDNTPIDGRALLIVRYTNGGGLSTGTIDIWLNDQAIETPDTVTGALSITNWEAGTVGNTGNIVLGSQGSNGGYQLLTTEIKNSALTAEEIENHRNWLNSHFNL